MPLRPLVSLSLLVLFACYCAPTMTHAAEAPAETPSAKTPANKTAGELPPDLGTRKAGKDWPAFLGPTADSKSSEHGILTKWSPKAPPIVWQHRLGTGYGMPTVSRGRLFQFSRFGRQARLECLKSETGESLWQFEYPTDYEDLYGYDNGPRCSPVVDRDRVYIFGAEGMLHCLRIVDGELLWKVDTQEKFGVVQNFFGVGSTPVIFRDLLICQIGGSADDTRNVPPGQLDRVRGKDSGVVAFDKLTGAVRYQTSDELASYAGPTLATIARPAVVLCLCSRWAVGPEPNRMARSIFISPGGRASWKASTPAIRSSSTTWCSFPKPMAPAAPLLQVQARRLRRSLERQGPSPRQATANALEHADPHDGYVYGSSGRHPENAELRCVELRRAR